MRTFRWMGLAVVGLMTGCYEDPAVAPNPNPGPEKTVFVATGALVAERVDEFRSALGPPNGATPGDQLTGRREIAWDAGATAPFDNRDDFPSDFFNTVVTVGAVYKTSGTGLRNDTELFRGINPTYSTEFNFFSPVKTFSPIGGNILDQLFEVAGERTPAVTRGFGIVFSDVDLADKTTIELFAQDDTPLGTFAAPVRSDETGLSFVGVTFEDPIIALVRITLGTGALGATVNDVTSGGRVDVVVLDNVIYGEPREAQSR
jgi:hypothetical protein